MFKKRIIVLFIISVFFCFGLSAQETEEDIADISLDDLLNQEVTVAGKKAQSISDSPGIISVITEKDIKELGIVNLVDVFSYVPGFTVTDNYWTREIVTAREVFQALYNDKILLLIDGMPAYEAINTEYYLDLIPVEAVKRIEIIRGPGSTLYGTNAFAGVINIITKEGSDINGIEVSALAGGNNFLEKTVTAGTKTGETEIFFSGSIRDDDGEILIIPYDEGRIKNLRQSFRKEFTKAFLKIKYKEFTAAAQFLELDYDHFGMTPNQWAQGIARHHTFNLNLSYKKEINKKLSTLNMFRIMRQVRNNEAGIFGTLFPGSDKTTEGVQATAPTYIDWKSYIYQLETQWNYTFSDKFSIVGGATAEKRDPYNITTMFNEWGLHEEDRIVGLEGSYKYPPEKNKIDFGVYLQGDLRINKLGIVGGLRYAYMGVAEKSFIAPRAAVIYKLTDGFNIKALYGIAFRSPSIYEAEVNIRNVLYGGKTNIDPEKVTTYEFGLDYVGKKFSARANYYIMKIEDIIIRRPLTDAEKAEFDATGGVIYDNINNQDLTGLEFELKAFPSKNFKFFVNGSFRTGEDSKTDKEINYVAKKVFAGGLNLTIPALKTTFSPNFYYVDKRSGIALDGQKYTFDDYFIVNLTINVELSKKLNVSLIGKNIFDKTYYYPEMTRNKIGIKLPGNTPITIFMKVAYRFDI